MQKHAMASSISWATFVYPCSFCTSAIRSSRIAVVFDAFEQSVEGIGRIW